MAHGTGYLLNVSTRVCLCVCVHEFGWIGCIAIADVYGILLQLFSKGYFIHITHTYSIAVIYYTRSYINYVCNGFAGFMLVHTWIYPSVLVLFGPHLVLVWAKGKPAWSGFNIAIQCYSVPSLLAFVAAIISLPCVPLSWPQKCSTRHLVMARKRGFLLLDGMYIWMLNVDEEREGMCLWFGPHLMLHKTHR